MLQRKPYIHLRCSPGASAAELATGFDSVPYGAATWRFRKGATFLGTVASQSSRQMAREPVLRVWAVEAHGVRGGGVTGASATKMSMVMGGRPGRRRETTEMLRRAQHDSLRGRTTRPTGATNRRGSCSTRNGGGRAGCPTNDPGRRETRWTFAPYNSERRNAPTERRGYKDGWD